MEKAAPEKVAKTGGQPAAKKAAAKKAPAKKATAKKAPATSPPAKPPSQTPASPRIDTNGQLAAAAKDVAAHAKSAVDAARNPLAAQPGPSSGRRSPVPLAVAIAISLLAVLLVRRLRRDDD